MENWKDINGYEGLYQVSDTGKVRSLKYHRGKMTKEMKLKKDKRGYLIIGLRKDNKKRFFGVHRLVAEAFLPNPDNKPEIDHIIPVSCGGTNEVSNLRWCTHKENSNNPLTMDKLKLINKGIKRTDEQRKRLSNAKKGKYTNTNNPNAKPVLQYDKDMNLIREWPCAIDAVNEIGCSPSMISMCCNGLRKTHKGFIWKYKKEVA